MQRITNDYLDKEPFTSASVDGWENQAGDSVKMVNAIDSKCHSFLVGIVDDPGEAGDAEAYKKLWNLNSTAATTLEVLRIIRV